MKMFERAFEFAEKTNKNLTITITKNGSYIDVINLKLEDDHNVICESFSVCKPYDEIVTSNHIIDRLSIMYNRLINIPPRDITFSKKCGLGNMTEKKDKVDKIAYTRQVVDAILKNPNRPVSVYIINGDTTICGDSHDS